MPLIELLGDELASIVVFFVAALADVDPARLDDLHPPISILKYFLLGQHRDPPQRMNVPVSGTYNQSFF